MTNKPDIVDIIRNLAAGEPVDWSGVDAPADQSTRALLKELQIVARVAQTHGTVEALVSADPAPRPDANQPTAAPRTWGPLTLLECVGQGTYGEVYRAWESRLEREVALKLIAPDAAAESTDGTAIQEARLLARVRHPNVITVHGADCFDGRVGIWTEFVNGQTLEQLLQEQGRFAPDDACRIIGDVCRGLAAVHRAGLVHGDVKSTNVMRDDTGRILLMDFGASHETDAGGPPRLGGTPAYMAPELFAGEPHSIPSDVYSVGVLLYRLLTNSYPLIGRTMGELRDAHQRGQVRSLGTADPTLASRLVAVADRALHRDPAHRYPSADALADDLARIAQGSGRRRWLIAAAVAGVIAAAAAAAVLLRTPPTAQARLNFAPRDYVLITKFENRTGEPVFDGAVEYALQRELTTSAVVSVLPDERVDDALVLMKRARGTVIDREVGREVALRDGHVKAVLAGRVERFGSSYVITAQLIDPADNAVVATIGETAEGQNAVVSALQRQARRVRIELGEKARDIRGADPSVEQAATDSLQAFQLYNESYQLGRQGNWPAALEVARRMVQVDPQFASGWTWLAWAVNNTTPPNRRAENPIVREYATRAVQLSERVPEWERHWIQGSAYTLSQQPVSAIPHYEALLRLRPDHYYALNNLWTSVARLHRPEDNGKFYALLQMLGRQRPNDPQWVATAALAAVRESRDARTAKPFLDQLSVLSRPDQAVVRRATFERDFVRAHISLLVGDLPTALEQVHAIEVSLNDYSTDRHVEAITGVLGFYRGMGRIADAKRFATSLLNGPDSVQARRALARLSGDWATVRHLIGQPNRPANSYIQGPEYVQLGMLDAAREYVKGNAPNFAPQYAEVTMGQLALLEGDLVAAISHLERGLELMGFDAHPTYFWGCESLADALWRSDRRNDAIERLTECTNNDIKNYAAWAPRGEGQSTMELHLARLHRATGNLAAALDLEARVRKRLALADPDYPLLKQLPRD